MLGTIQKVEGTGGILQFRIKNEDGSTSVVMADNGPAIRAFDAVYGGVINPDHSFNVHAIVGKRIEYYTDDVGLMTGFEPA